MKILFIVSFLFVVGLGAQAQETKQPPKAPVAPYPNPAILKDRTDGELFYITKIGKGDMPPEGARVKTDELWDLVNYVRSLAKKNPPADKPAR